MSCIALIVAAGRGSRAGDGPPKQYRLLGGRPVLSHALWPLCAHPGITEVRVVIHPDDRDLYENAAAEQRLGPAITGSATRRESVLVGLQAIAASGGAQQVLIHDAARPFLPTPVIDRLLAALNGHEAAIPVLDVVDSLVRDGETLPRAGIKRVQTPQAFGFEALLAVHRAWSGDEPTDDAEMMRLAGHKVAEVKGDERLRKLTTAEDFAEAEAAFARALVSRTGLGIDVHAFGPGDRLWLAGVEIAHDRGLMGHSDADVALHALTDALLGCIAEGDIGTHFPPSDPKWRGVASSVFVTHAVERIAAHGGVIDHVDLTIIAEEPKIGPHRDAMRQAVARLLRLDPGRISIKATTTERLGFTGRGEGIAAQSVATVRLPEGT